MNKQAEKWFDEKAREMADYAYEHDLVLGITVIARDPRGMHVVQFGNAKLNKITRDALSTASGAEGGAEKIYEGPMR